MVEPLHKGPLLSGHPRALLSGYFSTFFNLKTDLMNNDDPLTNPIPDLNLLPSQNIYFLIIALLLTLYLFLQQIFSSRDSIRKGRETFLITKANALEPNALNKRDKTY